MFKIKNMGICLSFLVLMIMMIAMMGNTYAATVNDDNMTYDIVELANSHKSTYIRQESVETDVHNYYDGNFSLKSGIMASLPAIDGTIDINTNNSKFNHQTGHKSQISHETITFDNDTSLLNYLKWREETKQLQSNNQVKSLEACADKVTGDQLFELAKLYAQMN